MSALETVILGQAVFGTTQGLTAQGDGVLAGAKNHVSIFEFEIFRRQGGGQHTIPIDQPALFVRRVTNEAGHEINLIGFVAPCRDYTGRRGFFGSCLAVRIDQTSPRASFSDWVALADQLNQLYEETIKFYDQATERLRWPNLLQTTGREPPYQWETLPGDSVLLFEDFQPRNSQEIAFSDIIQRLQALAFMHGHTTTTIIATTINLPGSQRLREDWADQALRAFSEAKKQANTAPKAEARATRAQKGSAEQEIESLWREVNQLHDELNMLKAHLKRDRQGYAMQSNFDKSLRNALFDNDQRESFGPQWLKITIIGLAALLTLIFSILAIVWISSGDRLLDASPPTEIMNGDAAIIEPPAAED